jgi:hypothetical protein
MPNWADSIASMIMDRFTRYLTSLFSLFARVIVKLDSFLLELSVRIFFVSIFLGYR